MVDTMELDRPSSAVKDEHEPASKKAKKDEPQATVKMEVDEGDSSKQKQTKKHSVFDTVLLKLYYDRLFPYREMFRWLSYGHDPAKRKENKAIDAEFFARREFSFTIENDVYLRYESFKDENELREAIRKKQPHKIDIGAVYSSKPKLHKSVTKAMEPKSRELVFDIDLDDYAEVRVGCTSDMMWEKGSWQYFAVAMKVLDRALRDDFGYKHLFWVFSGRRGVHCWVCDEEARNLEDREREAIVKYLTLITGTDNSSNRVTLTTPLHPSIQKALPMLEEVFNDVVLGKEKQDFFKDPKNWDKVLQFIPDTSIKDRLRNAWEKEDTTSEKKWKQLKATVEGEAKKQKSASLKRVVPAIIVFCVYPRLDINVSTHRNHLLKSPFVIHPKTGKVCVPILDVSNAHEFDPDNVPTLPSLVEELDRGNCASGDKDQYKKTSMKPYIDGFEQKFLTPLYKDIKTTFREASQRQAAFTGDW